MLLPRILTAVVGVPVVLILIHIGNFPYMAFVFTVIILSLWEYAALMRMGGKPVQKFPLFFFGLLVPIAFVFDFSSGPGPGHGGFLVPVIAAAVLFSVFWEFFARRKFVERIAVTLLGVFLISLTLSFMIGVRRIRPDGEGLTFILFGSVWIMDTAAYFAGRFFGSRRLSPISPKKTWEGAIAGFAGAIGAVFLLRTFFPNSISPAGAWCFGAIIGTLGQVSDIAESMIKRAAGAKDSSEVLPGHGGILDRFDSYIFLAPAVYYFFVFFRGA